VKNEFFQSIQFSGHGHSVSTEAETEMADYSGLPLLGDVSALNEITGVSFDSKSVLPGHAFVPFQDPEVELHIKEALEKGARVIVREGDPGESGCGGESNGIGAKYTELFTEDGQKALALISSKFWGKVPKRLLAVTGTNGKTSIVNFAMQILALLGKKSASLGTLGCRTNSGYSIPPEIWERVKNFTTYEPVALHQILNGLAERGVEYAALETTSHGLHEYRVAGLRFNVGALTNVTQDHLDYHGTMQAYAECKMRLFSDLIIPGSKAVFNKHSDRLSQFEEKARSNGLDIKYYSIYEHADICAVNASPMGNGTIFTLNADGQVFENVIFPVGGNFQLENLLCAASLVVYGSGGEFTFSDVVNVIPQLVPIPGRLEFVGEHKGGKIFVDYCHTADAIERVLTEFRQRKPKRLIILFGCGGDRDKGKRPLMGEVSERLADKVIITDDNSRSVDPAEIRRDIMVGCPHAIEIGGRKEAMTKAVLMLEEGDILVVAGRGHEEFQKIGGIELPLNDKRFIESVLASF
jgi:UDP-N-acetylmuramoyl-L-alanyl-D-glutamate--2,6-diaminopimelate ligase